MNPVLVLFLQDALNAKGRGVDERTLDLARYFLRGESFNTECAQWALAGAIQAAIEDWMGEADEKYESAIETLRDDNDE